jgi:predicted  nucleic acid-binding Zn-ribbon protein
MSDLQSLFQLQELDLQIEAHNALLQEIASALGETGEMTTAQAQINSLREMLHDQEQRMRELEWDVDEINRQVSDEESKMYGGKVKNPKELQDLQKDVNLRQDRRRKIEERELEIMSDVDATQAELQRAQEELSNIRLAWEDNQRKLAERQTATTESIEMCRAKRSQVSVTVTPQSISIYEKLRREKRGRAVSKVERSTCLGCRIALPMGLISRIRGRDFAYCPSCGRILYQ